MEIERKHGNQIDYYQPEIIDFDYMLFSLADGDITKVKMIEEMEAGKVYEWYYIQKVRELNEIKSYTKIKDE